MAGRAAAPQGHRMIAAAPLSLRLCSRLWTAISLDVPPMEDSMTAFNAVRFRVKPGCDQEFLDAHTRVATDWQGLRRVNIIKTGEHDYCIMAEWSDMDAIFRARPQMIATLDTFRYTLEDLGGGLGVTDPVSGPVVLERAGANSIGGSPGGDTT